MSSSALQSPIIPPEIINEILRDVQLNENDLANCCLIPRSWLKPARQSLYDSLWIHLLCDDAVPDLSIFSSSSQEQNFHHLDSSSTKLLSMLIAHPSLGQLVHGMSLKAAGSREITPGFLSVRMRPQDILATFCQLCPSAKKFTVEKSWWFFECCKVSRWFRRYRLDELTLSEVTPKDWEDLRHFGSLKRLRCNIRGNVFVTSPPDQSSSQFPLEQLSISGCPRAHFVLLRPSISQTLRKLTVPTTVLPVLRLPLFPALYRLEIVWTPSSRPVESSLFLADLPASTSLRVLELGDRVYDAFGDNKRFLGDYLPSSCHRVNLTGPASLDTILSVTERSHSGHRVRQVGLDSKDRNDERSLRLVAAIRAILAAVDVELIWRD